MACCIENKKPMVLIFKIHNSNGELYICGGGSEKGPSAFFQNGASKYVQGPPIYTCIYMCKVLPYTHVYICARSSHIHMYIYVLGSPIYTCIYICARSSHIHMYIYVQGPPIYTCIYMCKVLPYTHVYICARSSHIHMYIYMC